ncbi:hypothetical protein ACIQCJ_19365 [Streptomyces sp. NPDC093221]|uniref:hypothetical protein n=1 Tax=Streptomyces sp. NPDC093221 TaxID=3366032 RepID=UPI003813F30D
MRSTTDTRRSTVRRGAVGLALAAALAATVTGTASADPAADPAALSAASSAATDAPAPPPYSSDFSDCPALPAGVDATLWKCEVLTATGSLTLGSRTIPELAPMTLTHAEGPLPDGADGQVWGALRSAPDRVPGGLTGIPGADRDPLLRLSLRPEYGGRSDFFSVGDRLGLFTLRFRALSPLLPHGCVIGGGDTPVELRLVRSGGSRVVSQDPPVIAFDAYGTAFTVPGATGCGPLDRLVDNRLGLPAATGNAMRLSAYYTFRTYDQLPPR